MTRKRAAHFSARFLNIALRELKIYEHNPRTNVCSPEGIKYAFENGIVLIPPSLYSDNRFVLAAKKVYGFLGNYETRVCPPPVINALKRMNLISSKI